MEFVVLERSGRKQKWGGWDMRGGSGIGHGTGGVLSLYPKIRIWKKGNISASLVLGANSLVRFLCSVLKGRDVGWQGERGRRGGQKAPCPLTPSRNPWETQRIAKGGFTELRCFRLAGQKAKVRESKYYHGDADVFSMPTHRSGRRVLERDVQKSS